MGVARSALVFQQRTRLWCNINSTASDINCRGIICTICGITATITERLCIGMHLRYCLQFLGLDCFICPQSQEPLVLPECSK